MKKAGPETPRSGQLSPEDHRIWKRVSGSVTPPRARKPTRITTPGAPLTDPTPAVAQRLIRPVMPKATPTPPPGRSSGAPRPAAAQPETLEPNRHRRLSRERDPIDGRIDLHGFGRFEAEDQLRAFLVSGQTRGWRAVLVITGRGRMGGGVIRASVHEWLQSTPLRGVVSGFASAHRRHGGDGAIYVTLKRRKGA